MESRYGRLTDLLEVVGLLQSRLTGISIGQIADRFDVSRRTAERMLAALRDRFPELEPEIRDGHKYWRLPRSSRIVAVRIPEELEILTQRITQLEADIEDREVAEGQLRAISEDVLGASAVGLFVLDANFRVVWVNHAVESYFEIRAADVIGQDKRRLVRERIRDIFADPVEFERRVIGSYDDNHCIENFECHILAGGSRDERWLEHWSQPIEKGPYAGGRIEHYVDITALVAARGQFQEAPPEIAACALRSFCAPLAELQAAADWAVRSGDDPNAALAQISRMAGGIRRAADLSVRLASSDGANAARTSSLPILEAVSQLIRDAASAAGVRVEVCAEPELADVFADRVPLISALAELARGVIGELPDGSRLCLGAEFLDATGSVRFSLDSAALPGGTAFLELPGGRDRSRKG